MMLSARRWLHRRRMSVVGITRFSAIFRDTHPYSNADLPFDLRVDHLFEAERLQKRIAIWEAVTLPSLAAQTDPDFKLLLVTSSLLPPWALDRIEGLLARQPYPSLVLTLGPDESFTKSVRRGVRSLVEPTHGRVGTFRLDDADALAADWVSRFRTAVEAGQKTVPAPEIYGFENSWFLSAGQGQGQGVRLHAATRRLIACGLARVSPRAPLRTVHSTTLSHNKLDDLLATKHCGGAPAWIVTAHELNDSDRMHNADLLAAPMLTPSQAAARLGPSFSGIDIEQMANALGR
ncbi:MAG: glycosyltransferase [Pikeienuella sp.]